MELRIAEGGRCGAFTLGRLVPQAADCVGKSGESRSGRDFPVQVGEFGVGVGVDKARQQRAAEKLDPRVAVDLRGALDANEPPLRVEGEYRRAEPALRSPREV